MRKRKREKKELSLSLAPLVLPVLSQNVFFFFFMCEKLFFFHALSRSPPKPSKRIHCFRETPRPFALGAWGERSRECAWNLQSFIFPHPQTHTDTNNEKTCFRSVCCPSPPPKTPLISPKFANNPSARFPLLSIWYTARKPRERERERFVKFNGAPRPC